VWKQVRELTAFHTSELRERINWSQPIEVTLFIELTVSVYALISRNLMAQCRFFFLLWCCDPTRVMTSSFLRFLDHTRHTTVSRTPLDEWSARRRDLYLTTHDTHNRQTSMPPVGFETHDLSRRATADLRLRPRGHWDRHNAGVCTNKYEPYSTMQVYAPINMKLTAQWLIWECYITFLNKYSPLL